jgi:cytochrome b561
MESNASKAEVGYTSTAKLLHWLVLVLLIVQFTLAWTMPHIGRNTVPETLINLHFSFGIVVLAVVIIRLLWRWTHPEPTPLDGLPPWQITTARIVHYLLYLLLLVLPVLGWVNASFRGYDVTPFGLFTLPKLVATRAPGFAWTGDVHVWLSTYALLGLVGLHVIAALYHAARQDGVFSRMLPTGRS